MTNSGAGRPWIHLVGPGGAGKSTVGPLLADHIGCPFYDLDRHFSHLHGSIDVYIEAQGYLAYARANVEAYRDLGHLSARGVIALSSGFMTYVPGVHPACVASQSAIEHSPTTFVLLPSLEFEVCVAETVTRQTSRGAGRTTASLAEVVIRERFSRYAGLRAPKVTTMRPPAEIAADLVVRLPRPHHVP